MKASLVLLVLVLPHLSHAVISIQNNGYHGITVAIHNHVPDEPKLVENIKELFLSGSRFLFEASRHRAYFNEVTIVVPDEWEHRPEYEVVRRSGHRFSSADIRVDLPNEAYGDAPYTLQPGGCGESGDYIHLTPDFIRTLTESGASAYGNPGKVLVHEWAHLRYGVFDEHGYQQDSRTPAFYKDNDGKIRYTACTSDVPGWLRDETGDSCRRGEDGLPDNNCLFYPDVEKATAKASVMSMPYLPSVDGFCDDTSNERKHNSFAPNMQNLMCSGRSTWSVLMDHGDFMNDRNTATEMHVDPIPLFRVVQPKKNDNPTFVLVLDVSSSMRGRRMKLLHKAASRFIKYQLADYSSLGMVAFSTNVQVLSNITSLDKFNREMLVDRVPVEEDEGYTAIGGGILEGLNLLSKSREPTEGSLLLLVTDGEENVGPSVEEVIPQIKKSRVTINTIAFGKEASKLLEMLVTITGGRGFFFDDLKVGHKALDSAFLESASMQSDVEIQPVEVLNRYWFLESEQEITANFTLDKEIGTNTRFLLTYDYPSTLFVVLIAPDGKKYDSRSPFYTDDLKTNTIQIQFKKAEPGHWSFIVQNKGVLEQDISVVLTSEAVNIREQPIRVRAWVAEVNLTFPAKAKVFAEVKKGYNAILDASVIATVDGPTGEPHIMLLYDNGIGADTVADDGIYSGYFTNFNGSGRYSVEAVVANNGKARMKMGSRSSSAPPAHLFLPFDKENNEISDKLFESEKLLAPQKHNFQRLQYTSVDEFERSVTAGSFRLDKWEPGDFMPPGRVTDLQIISTNEHQVELQWTLPGDNMNEGTAALIEVGYHIDMKTVLTSFNNSWFARANDVLEGTLTQLSSAGQRHRILLKLKIPKELTVTHVFLAIRAIDSVGNVADISNIVQVPIVVKAAEKESDPILYVILAVSAAALLLLLAVVTVICIRSKRKKRKYKCKHQHQLLSATA